MLHVLHGYQRLGPEAEGRAPGRPMGLGERTGRLEPYLHISLTQMSAPARLHFLICPLNLVPTGARISVAPRPLSAPGGGGKFLFVPSDRWPGCALFLSIFFLTFSWVYGSDEAREGT